MDATVSTLVTELSNGQADLTQAAQFYNELLSELARIPLLVDSFLVTVDVHGIGTLPSNAVGLLYLFQTVGSDTFQLGELSVKEASWVFPGYVASAPTVPMRSYILEGLPPRQFLVPDLNGVGGRVIAFCSNVRATLPVILQLPIALLILEHEYRRESDHKNMDISKASGMLGNFLLQIVLKRE